ncbi:glycosyltransferase family 4 protein [Anaerolineae bacterium CFX9]|nr:glycosyltransferase family 4 protein [Anaerolineae bacterium CFX9]
MSNKRVAILHYASPPVVGGVEATIAFHARGLAARGYHVRVISGRGGTFDPRVETVILPRLGSTHPDVLGVKRALDQGTVPPEFEPLVTQIVQELRPVLEDCDAVITHNAHSLNKNLPFTAALAKLTEDLSTRWIAWCHDLAWTNSQYQPELREGYPYDLLRTVWNDTVYVTVSEARRPELAELLRIDPGAVEVVVPGVDPAGFFHWTPVMQRLADRLGWMDADGLLLLPARLTRRKNIALALRVLAEIRSQSGCDYRLIVTGPPGPHNPANPGYLGELLDLRRDLELDSSVHFLYQYGESEDDPLIPDDATMANLYLTCDALFFPSTQEGFGIPVLEAGLAGIPAFCADIPPLRGTGGEDAFYFDPVNGAPAEIAALVLRTLDNDPRFRLRNRVRQQFRWDAIIDHQIIPLIEG